jgi:regulator of sirC expression with transglutaminase-like and TPR domain
MSDCLKGIGYQRGAKPADAVLPAHLDHVTNHVGGQAIRVEAISIAAINLQIEQRRRYPVGFQVYGLFGWILYALNESILANDIDWFPRCIMASAKSQRGTGLIRQVDAKFIGFRFFVHDGGSISIHLLYNGGMNLDASLNLLAARPNAPMDLAEIAFELARDEYPNLDVEAYLSQLSAMAHEAQRYMSGDFEARLAGLCRYLFHDMGFRGNVQSYYDPRNSYLNEVLERRTGIPITLSIVAMAIGSRAGIEIAGVGLPGHFIVKAIEDNQELLFDPFHGGRRLTPEECEHVVQQATGQPFQVRPEVLRATPPGLIVQRMLSNLKNIYMTAKDFRRAIRVIGRLLQLKPEDSIERRDLGICLVQTGSFGPAIDHLSAYLASSSANGEDPIRHLLDQAKAEVARWN